MARTSACGSSRDLASLGARAARLLRLSLPRVVSPRTIIADPTWSRDMSFGIAFIIVAALFGLFVFTSSFKIVGQAEVMVIERLGRFHHLARSGFNILIPFIERPKSIDVRFLEADVGGQKRIASRTTSRIDLREQGLNFSRQPGITQDNVTIDIDAVLYYRVADPQKATYSIQNLPYALETLTRTTLRNIVGDIELDQTLEPRHDQQENARRHRGGGSQLGRGR